MTFITFRASYLTFFFPFVKEDKVMRVSKAAATVAPGERAMLTAGDGEMRDLPRLSMDKQKEKETKRCTMAYWVFNSVTALYILAILGVMIAQLSKATHDTVGEYELMIVIGIVAGLSLMRTTFSSLCVTCRMIELRSEKHRSIWPCNGLCMIWHLLLTIGHSWTFIVAVICYNAEKPTEAMLGSTKPPVFYTNLWMVTLFTSIDSVLWVEHLYHYLMGEYNTHTMKS
jgi:hypothetical protein